MNVEIRDSEAFQSLSPPEVVAYLRSHGWAQSQKSDPPKWLSWIRTENDEEFEGLQPLDRSFRDYSIRMRELMEVLSAVEKRSQSEIYADLLTTFADIVRIRIDDSEILDGTLPIEINAQIAQKTRDLMLAAACSATGKKAVWHSRKPQQAVDQVKKVRIGQSERGSYIVTVISRVSPALELPGNGQLFETAPPFERQVIQTLATSLDTLDKAAASAAISGQMDAFDASVSKGVSANLCDAVTGLWGDDNGNRCLEFSFSWSPARPVSANIPSKIRFTADRIPFIREAARVMKEREPIGDFELAGTVVKLEKGENAQFGRVTVLGLVEGKPKRVCLELKDSDYQLAIDAHKHERSIRCLGTLNKEGKGLVLQNPLEVSIDQE